MRKEREGKEGREERAGEAAVEDLADRRSVMMSFSCSVDSDSLQPLFAAHQAALTFSSRFCPPLALGVWLG